MHNLRLLGGASLYGPDGHVVTGPAGQPRRLAVLALLADDHPGVLSRDKAVAVLWPDRPDARARRLLTQALYELRKELGREAILGPGDTLRLDPELLGVDLLDFRAALERDDWLRAVEIYDGPALDGFLLSRAGEFQRWADQLRATVARNHQAALEALADEAEAEGRASEAVRWLQKLTVERPYDGGTVERLVRALERAGNRPAALEEARAYAARMRADLGLEADERILDLMRVIRDETDWSEEGDEADLTLSPARPASGSDPESPGRASRWASGEVSRRGFLRRLPYLVLLVIVTGGAGAAVLDSAEPPGSGSSGISGSGGPVATEGRVLAAYGSGSTRKIAAVQPGIDSVPAYSMYFLHAMVAGLLE